MVIIWHVRKKGVVSIAHLDVSYCFGWLFDVVYLDFLESFCQWSELSSETHMFGKISSDSFKFNERFVGGFYYLKFHPVMKGSYHWGVLLIFQPSNSFFKKGRWFLGVLCCLCVKQRRYFLLSNPGFRWFLFNTMFFSMFTGWKLPESIRCSPGVVQFVIVFKLFYHGKITIIPT